MTISSEQQRSLLILCVSLYC